MKTIAAALTTLVVLAMAAGLLLFRSGPEKSDKKQAEASRPFVAVQPEEKQAAADGSMQRIAELAALKNPPAREELVAMYVKWAGQPDRVAARRAIIRKILENEEPAMALQVIVTAVSRDPTPLKSDEMLTAVARDMTVIWKDPDIFSKGMDVFRVSEGPKAKALLAESLSVRVVSPTSGMTDVADRRYPLVADLTHVYQNAEDSDLKTHLLQNIQAVGGSEMAELAIDPLNSRAAYYRKIEAQEEAERRNPAPAPPPVAPQQ